jgi:hypothetical protein
MDKLAAHDGPRVRGGGLRCSRGALVWHWRCQLRARAGAGANGLRRADAAGSEQTAYERFTGATRIGARYCEVTLCDELYTTYDAA